MLPLYVALVVLGCSVSGEKCPPLPLVEHGHIDQVTEDEVKFRCDEGYVVEGPEDLHCSDGSWPSEGVPRCLKSDISNTTSSTVTTASLLEDTKERGQECPPLPMLDLEHGQIIRINKDKLRFTCDRGYFMVGPKQLRCTDGHWSPEGVPKCLKTGNHCEAPVDFPNTNRHGDETYVGARVMYTCRAGYFMYGNVIRSCLRSLKWSGRTPACQAEAEPLANVATRLENQFMTKMGAGVEENNVARLLDDKSLKAGLELVILLDSSSSIDPEDFSRGINFVKFLANEFDVKNVDDLVAARIALVTFGDKEKIEFNLNDAGIDSPEAAMDRLDSVQPLGGGTAMQPALSTVLQSVAPLMRPRAKRALFLITDGVPNRGDSEVEPEDVARFLRNKQDMEIFALGVGSGTDRIRLSRIASEPPINHVFMLNQYSDFDDMVWLMKNKPTPAPPPPPEKCGYLHDTNKKSEERAPWLTAVYVKIPGDGGNRLSFCTGSLICSNWVLTAASCFYARNDDGTWTRVEDDVYVTLGEKNLAKNDRSQKNFYSVQVMVHPDYEEETSTNNIALIQLNSHVPLNVTYRPVCLPRRERPIPLAMDANTKPIITGWGTKETHRDSSAVSAATVRLTRTTVQLPRAGETDCIEKLGRSNVGNHMFCVGYGSPVNGSCSGDEGAPVTAFDESTGLYHLLGVMNRRRWCGISYSVFTLVRDYIEWIDWATGFCSDLHLP